MTIRTDSALPFQVSYRLLNSRRFLASPSVEVRSASESIDLGALSLPALAQPRYFAKRTISGRGCNARITSQNANPRLAALLRVASILYSNHYVVLPVFLIQQRLKQSIPRCLIWADSFVCVWFHQSFPRKGFAGQPAARSPKKD